MKYILGILIALLVATNAALLFKQQRIELAVAAVQSENRRLTEELAARPVMPAEEVRAAQTRIERANAIMDAVENRLTNATAALAQIQSQTTRPVIAPSGTSGATARPVTPPTGAATLPEPYTSFLQIPEAPLQTSSSHTPTGELQQRSWGPEQVVGPPNTHQAGDIPTAWAPRDSQGRGEEWLHLNYDKSVDLAQVNVRETYNPGAISKVAAVMPDGREVVVWEGTEPPAQAPVDMSFTVPPGLQAQSVKVYLDRTRVSGWNEIDAVELVGRDGTRQWASSATASSSYAEPRTTAAVQQPSATGLR